MKNFVALISYVISLWLCHQHGWNIVCYYIVSERIQKSAAAATEKKLNRLKNTQDRESSSYPTAIFEKKVDLKIEVCSENEKLVLL